MTGATQGLGRAAVTVLLISGGLLLGAGTRSTKETAVSLATLRAHVREIVTDAGRTGRALAALDSAQALLPAFGAFQSRTSSELRGLLRDYDSARVDFDQAAARWETGRSELRARALAAHEAFKQALTDAEWEKLRDEERKILFQYPVVQPTPVTDAKEEER